MPLNAFVPTTPSGTVEASVDLLVRPQETWEQQARRAGGQWSGGEGVPSLWCSAEAPPPSASPWTPPSAWKGWGGLTFVAGVKEESSLVPVTGGYEDLSALLYVLSESLQGIN